MKKSKKKLVLLIIVIIVIGVGAFWYINNKKATSKTESTYTTATAVKGDLKIEYTDEGSADIGIKELKFTIDGTINEIKVKENDVVKKGTVLMTIDDKDYVTSSKQADISYQNSKISYEKSKVSLQTTLTTLKSQVDDAKTKLDLAKDKYEDLLVEYKVEGEVYNTVKVDDSNLKTIELEYNSMLASPSAYSQNEIKNKEISYENAKSNYNTSINNAISELKEAKSNYDSTVSDYNKAVSDYNIEKNMNYDEKLNKLSLDKAILDYKTSKDELNDTKLVAPYDCRILNITVKVGDDVTKDTVVMQVRKNENPMVISNVAESDIGNVTVGMDVEVTSDNLEGQIFTGKVTKISNVATDSENTVSYEVDMLLDKDYEQIKDNMTCNISFIIQQKKDCIKIPNKAVYMENGSQYVKVLGSDNKVTAKKITTGFTDGTDSEVIEGLNEGDTVTIAATSSSTKSTSTKSSSSKSSSSKSTSSNMPPMYGG